MTTQTVDFDPFISPALNKFFKKWGFTRSENENIRPLQWAEASYCAIIKGVAFWCGFKYGELQGVWVLGKDFIVYDLTAANMEKFIKRNISQGVEL